jgi:hypothetical protein
VDAASPPIQTRRKDARVIEHNQIIGTEQVGKVSKAKVTKASRATVHLQQAGCSAVGQGFLSDQFRGKMIVEFGNLHED